MDWFWSGDVRTIRIIDTNYQRIDLLVIPADTMPAIAEPALRMATDGHDPHITVTGSHDPASGCLPVEAQASPASDDIAGRRRIVLLPHGPAEQIDLPRPRSEGPPV